MSKEHEIWNLYAFNGIQRKFIDLLCQYHVLKLVDIVLISELECFGGNRIGYEYGIDSPGFLVAAANWVLDHCLVTSDGERRMKRFMQLENIR